MAIENWLNAPLYEGSRFLGWAVVIAAAALLLLLFLGILFRKRRKKKKARASTQKPASQVASTATPRTSDSFSNAGISVANLQGIGAREEQQDAFSISPIARFCEDGLLAVLCDGMGGMTEGGAIAQDIVAKIMERWPFDTPIAPDATADMLLEISDAVYSRYLGRGGATLAMAYIQGDRLWFWCAGDSDLFLLREQHLYALNARQEYGNDLLLSYALGDIPLRDALENPQAAALSQFMGNASVQFDYTRRPFPLKDRDVLLLCSDGVSDTLHLYEIAGALALCGEAACAAMERAIGAAQLPDQDNYTAIVIDYHICLGGNEHVKE